MKFSVLGERLDVPDSFAGELHALIDKWRDHPGVALADMVDAMETEVEALVEEVNER
jgi:hypothetical protein